MDYIYLLKVDPNTVWLRDDITNKAFIPDDNSLFDLRNRNISPVTTIHVGGADGRSSHWIIQLLLHIEFHAQIILSSFLLWP